MPSKLTKKSPEPKLDAELKKKSPEPKRARVYREPEPEALLRYDPRKKSYVGYKGNELQSKWESIIDFGSEEYDDSKGTVNSLQDEGFERVSGFGDNVRVLVDTYAIDGKFVLPVYLLTVGPCWDHFIVESFFPNVLLHIKRLSPNSIH